MEYNTGFIGAGNMGGALAAAVAKINSHVWVSDKDEKKAAELAALLNCKNLNNQAIASECRYIFFAVKPQFITDMIMEIREVLEKREDRFIIVTMAAGVTIQSITETLGFECPIIRIMPNTPVMSGEGMILYTVNDLVREDEITEFEMLLSKAGKTDRLPERMIDAGTAVSGCGPAYIYMLIEAMADGGVECGLSRSSALTYAAQTVLGAAKNVLETGKHPGQLKDEVCSPAGSTIKGVHTLEEHGFRAAVINAVTNAYEATTGLNQKKN